MNDLVGVLREIQEFIFTSPQSQTKLEKKDSSPRDPTPSPSPQAGRGDRGASPDIQLIKATELFAGDQVVMDESGAIGVVESVEYAWANDNVYDLTVAEDHSFVTLAGIGFNGHHNS